MEILRPFREKIEELDRQLANVVANRLRVCSEVAQVKKAAGIPMMQPDRVIAVRSAYAAHGRELGVSPDLMIQLAVLLVNEACRLEDEIIDMEGDDEDDIDATA